MKSNHLLLENIIIAGLVLWKQIPSAISRNRTVNTIGRGYIFSSSEFPVIPFVTSHAYEKRIGGLFAIFLSHEPY